MINDIDFMVGHCFNFAVALHRTFGYPLAILYGERTERGEELFVCIHAVAVKNGLAVDFEGIKESLDDVLEQLEADAIYEPYDSTCVLDYDNEDEFWAEIGRCGGAKSESVIEIACEYIKNNHQRFK
jgi:hypothetical protein